MPRKSKAKSQWDFGELFPTEETLRVLTVSELTTQVRRLLEQHLGKIWISGEVTNLRLQSSGHMYFTLKDASAQLSCVLFRGERVAHREALQDGQRVLLQGELSVYEPRGQYQLIVHEVELQGVGALQVAFEKLKRRLAEEGLFEAARKRPLPRYPQRIGVVTSPTGAALRDVIHVVERRNPSLGILLAGCRVQGDGAAAEIASAIRLLNEYHQSGVAFGQPEETKLDLILMTRGGGSLEDLWAFNEEPVARAIFESGLPVVSAVGHEIDFTIGDFVADLRAATPSAAAELITEGVFASRQFLRDAAERLPQLAHQYLTAGEEGFNELSRRLRRMHPRRILQEKSQYLDDLQADISRHVHQALRNQKTAWNHLRQRVASFRPAQVITQHQQTIGVLERQLKDQLRRRLEGLSHQQAQLAARLRLLAPENVLRRGYSITTDTDSGAILRDAGQALPGQKLTTQLHSGKVRSTVNS